MMKPNQSERIKLLVQDVSLYGKIMAEDNRLDYLNRVLNEYDLGTTPKDADKLVDAAQELCHAAMNHFGSHKFIGNVWYALTTKIRALYVDEAAEREFSQNEQELFDRTDGLTKPLHNMQLTIEAPVMH